MKLEVRYCLFCIDFILKNPPACAHVALHRQEMTALSRNYVGHKMLAAAAAVRTVLLVENFRSDLLFPLFLSQVHENLLLFVFFSLWPYERKMLLLLYVITVS